MSIEKLLPEWEVKGNGLGEFYTALKDLEGRTLFVEQSLDKVTLISLLCNSAQIAYGVEAPSGHWAGQFLKAGTYYQAPFVPVSQDIFSSVVKDEEENEKLIDSIDRVGCLLSYKTNMGKQSVSPMSLWALRDMADRVRCVSPAMQEPSLERDRFIVSHVRAQKVVLVKRVSDVNTKSVSKVFAVRGQTYKPVNQSAVIKRVLDMFNDKFGECEAISWSITNDLTTLLVSFPDNNKDIEEYYGLTGIKPIVRITTSDTGFSSFRVEAGMMVQNSTVFFHKNVVDQRHTSRFDILQFLESIRRHTFKELVAIPDEFTRLIGIKVVPEYAIDEALAYVKLSSKSGCTKIEHAIREMLREDFCFSPSTTAYDIVESMLTYSERLVMTNCRGESVEISQTTRNVVAETLGEVIFCPFTSSSADVTVSALPV